MLLSYDVTETGVTATAQNRIFSDAVLRHKGQHPALPTNRISIRCLTPFQNATRMLQTDDRMQCSIRARGVRNDFFRFGSVRNWGRFGSVFENRGSVRNWLTSLQMYNNGSKTIYHLTAGRLKCEFHMFK